MTRVLILTAAALVMASPMGACSGTQSQSDSRPEPVVAESGTKTAEAEISLEALIGTWDVALYYDPEAPPSATVLEITGVTDDGTLAGSFYQSPFSTGRARLFNDAVTISVVTSDGSGPYNTSGRLFADGRFEGQTFSIGRDFLMPWTATRQTAD